MSAALVWFRRDLRVHDHPALGAAVREYERVVPVFVLDSGAVLWSSDVSPYARARDMRVTEALRQAGIAPRPHGGNYVIDVSAPRTRQGGAYSRFSPFWRAWCEAERRPVDGAPRALAPLPRALRAGTLPRAAADLGVGDAGPLRAPIAAPGERAARAAARRWLAGPLRRYAERDDALVASSTSVLSPFLRWGCLSARELELRAAGNGGSGATAWIRPLAWRDFYAHVLLFWPDNTRLEFQWIASVGTDPAPAFRRMYNATLQARRLDPEGRYIRRWVPELARVPPRAVAEPWTLSRTEQRAAGCLIGRDYPAPIVDHRRERHRALQRYRAAGQGAT